MPKLVVLHQIKASKNVLKHQFICNWVSTSCLNIFYKRTSNLDGNSLVNWNDNDNEEIKKKSCVYIFFYSFNHGLMCFSLLHVILVWFFCPFTKLKEFKQRREEKKIQQLKVSHLKLIQKSTNSSTIYISNEITN